MQVAQTALDAALAAALDGARSLVVPPPPLGTNFEESKRRTEAIVSLARILKLSYLVTGAPLQAQSAFGSSLFGEPSTSTAAAVLTAQTALDAALADALAYLDYLGAVS